MQISLNVNRVYDCDVLVCGGGVSGIATAISAGRSGARVILIESGNCLGGIATEGLVGPFMTCFDTKGKTQIIKGIFNELIERLILKEEGIHPSLCKGGDCYSGYRTHGHIGVTPFTQEAFKRVAEEMCLESHVKIFYHTSLVDCKRVENKITCAYAYGGEELIKINAKAFADCTGNALLAKKAGASVYYGNNGKVQPSSTFFIIEGVDKELLDKHSALYKDDMVKLHYMEEIENAKKMGVFSSGTVKTRLFLNPDKKTWTVNMAQHNEDFNHFSLEEVSNVEIAQRAQIEEIIAFLRTLEPFRNVKLVKSADRVGIRESRRINAIYKFTLSDVQSGVKFRDRIAKCSNSVDVHQVQGVNYVANKSGDYYIPLSCMISKDISNLMAVGKCIDADRFAFGAVRVMPTCIAMGEAAGITLAISVKENVLVKDVDVLSVQQELRMHGAIID